MSDKTWKAVERKVAKALGAKREGAKGEIGFDVIAYPFGVEVKYRKKLPVLLKDAVAQAETARNKHAWPPYSLVVLAEHRARLEDYLCVLRFEDLLLLLANKGLFKERDEER